MDRADDPQAPADEAGGADGGRNRGRNATMMLDCADDFGPFHGRIWLNASHQGPLPRVAVEAGLRALALKQSPHELTSPRWFNEVPARLRSALGELLGAAPDDVILGNSASYGMHVLVHGIDWNERDEVLLVEGDFPTTTLPWLLARRRGVAIRFINPAGPMLTPDELRTNLSPRTRIFCTNWVHSFTGYALDEVALGDICRANGTGFVLNASQAVGARPLSVTDVPVEAIIGVGFKWLCGPYGTGYCWIDPTFREQMLDTQLYWLAHYTAEDLQKESLPELKSSLGARAYDIFGTANFNNFMPWTASIEYMNKTGIDRIAQHDQALIQHLIDSLDADRYEILSPRCGTERSTIAIISHKDRAKNPQVFERLRAAGIDNSLRRGNLRFAPHFYNTLDEIDSAIDLLNSV